MPKLSSTLTDPKQWNYQLKPCPTPFGLYIRTKRLEQGLTGPKCEDAWGLTRSTIKNYECGAQHPATEIVINRIAGGCGIEADELREKIAKSKRWLEECSDEDYRGFMKAQQEKTFVRRNAYLDRIMPRWFERHIYGNPHSGFNTYKGPTVLLQAVVPIPVAKELETRAQEIGCHIPDIVRNALENYMVAMEWDANLDRSNNAT